MLATNIQTIKSEPFGVGGGITVTFVFQYNTVAALSFRCEWDPCVPARRKPFVRLDMAPYRAARNAFIERIVAETGYSILALEV